MLSYKGIGDRIRLLLYLHNITQSELARRARMSTTIVNELFNGKAGPLLSLSSLDRVCESLGVEMHDFIAAPDLSAVDWYQAIRTRVRELSPPAKLPYKRCTPIEVSTDAGSGGNGVAQSARKNAITPKCAKISSNSSKLHDLGANGNEGLSAYQRARAGQDSLRRPAA